MRKTSVCGGLFAALMLGAGLGTVPASAAGPDFLHCEGTSTITYSPGLTNTPQQVTLRSTSVFPTCTSSDGSITSAQIKKSVHIGERSCNDPLNLGSGPLTIYYNDDDDQPIDEGQKSTYDSTFSATYVGGQLVVADGGPVTSGKFTGHTATGKAVYPDPTNLSECSTEGGVTELSGPHVIDIN